MNKIVIICLMLCFLSGTAQDNWCSEFKLIYKVTSENGVNLRKAKSLKSNVLLSVPYKGKVEACSCFTGHSEEEVQGKMGYWVKCKLDQSIGYIHSANLEQIECNVTSQISISIPRDGGVDQRINGFPVSCQGDIGIYIDRNPNNMFYSKTIIYGDTTTNYTKLYYGKVEENSMPYMIVHGGTNIQEKGSFEKKERMFLPGETYNYIDSNRNEEIKLYCTGNVSIDNYRNRISDYALHVIRDGSVSEVIKMDLLAYGVGEYEGGIWLKFIGDLDGDNNSEIILRVQSTYKGWTYLLLKWNGNNYNILRVGGGSPC